MRDVNSGWLIRYTQANVASFFFIFVYALNNKFIFSNNLFFYNSNFDTLAREIFKPLNKTKLYLSVLGLLQQDHPQPKKIKKNLIKKIKEHKRKIARWKMWFINHSMA